jgi:KipI family sensor histidine kinase inhibitor
MVEVRSPEHAAALASAIREATLAGVVDVVDVVGGLASVLVTYDPRKVSFESLTPLVRAIRARPRRYRSKTVVLATCFDGPDLEEVGALSGLGSAGVREALLGATLRVSVVGFAPGFAYLSGLPKALSGLPRRASPRPTVPAGSLALAGGHAAVYPQATPGGWNLVGRTDTVLFDPYTPPHALLRPGDTVVLRAVEPGELSFPVATQVRPFRSDRNDHVFEVESPGFFSSLQDGGRIGVAHLGVPRAGAADPVSYRLANALLGNDPAAACLEATVVGPRLVCTRPTHVVVVGAAAEATLDGREVGPGRVVPIAPGQHLIIGSTGWGMRAYMAVRGGFDAPMLLGSRSTDRLVGLGPGQLTAGDRLCVGNSVDPMGDHVRPGSLGELEAPGPRVLRVMKVRCDGDQDWDDGLFDRPFEVGVASDRVGIRLRSRGRPLSVPTSDVASAGTTIGTVQVPPDGNPVVLLPDHATLGGYPVGGVVIAADWGELGRCRPGDAIEFRRVTPEESAAALLALDRKTADAVVGHYPVATG